MRLSKFPISAPACTTAKLSRERNQNSMKRVMGEPRGDPALLSRCASVCVLKEILGAHARQRETKERGRKGSGVAVVSERTLALWEGAGGRILPR